MSNADTLSLPEDSFDDRLLEVLVESADAVSRGESVDDSLLNTLTPAERALLDTAWKGLRLLSGNSSSRSGEGQSASPPLNAMTTPLRIGRYVIERPLGSGGFALVYLARDPFTGRLAAIKIPRPHAQLTSHLRDKFVREAQASAQLDHPNVVAIYEAGVDDTLPYIASAYCDGPTLSEWVKDSADPVPARLAAMLIQELALGVQYSHDHGILHRDITPSNVLLFSQTVRLPGSSPYIPKLSDFGLAKMMEECDSETTMSLAMGTPAYVAPEQAANDRCSISPAVDIYGLGAVLYFVLTGRAPFVADSPWETLLLVRQAEPVPPHMIRPNVPRELDLICLKCLA